MSTRGDSQSAVDCAAPASGPWRAASLKQLNGAHAVWREVDVLLAEDASQEAVSTGGRMAP